MGTVCHASTTRTVGPLPLPSAWLEGKCVRENTKGGNVPKNKKKRDLEEFWIKRALLAEQQVAVLLAQLEAALKEQK